MRVEVVYEATFMQNQQHEYFWEVAMGTETESLEAKKLQ